MAQKTMKTEGFHKVQGQQILQTLLVIK